MTGNRFSEPKMIDLPRFVDDRGTLDQVFNADLPFEVKRIYTTKTHRGAVRAFHGHKREWKAFYVAEGSVKFLAFPMSENGKDNLVEFNLNTSKPQILVIPNGYYHGFASLTNSSSVVVLSNFTLEESKKDDFRLSPDGYLERFEVKHR